MKIKVHLRNPLGGSFCGLEGHQIYTRKDRELAGTNRLPEVNCKECLGKAMDFYKARSLEEIGMYNKISPLYSKQGEEDVG